MTARSPDPLVIEGRFVCCGKLAIAEHAADCSERGRQQLDRVYDPIRTREEVMDSGTYMCPRCGIDVPHRHEQAPNYQQLRERLNAAFLKFRIGHPVEWDAEIDSVLSSLRSYSESLEFLLAQRNKPTAASPQHLVRDLLPFLEHFAKHGELP